MKRKRGTKSKASTVMGAQKTRKILRRERWNFLIQRLK
jgi:hypothetical protein